MSVQDTKLASMWIKLNYLSDKERERSSFFSAHNKMYDLTRNDPEMAWSIMKIMWKLDSSEKILANIAAGPLEDLLVYHGEKFIDRVEEAAQSDPVFKKMLGAVWQNAIPDDVWNRVKAVAGPSF
jgi:hypothetical protein